MSWRVGELANWRVGELKNLYYLFCFSGLRNKKPWKIPEKVTLIPNSESEQNILLLNYANCSTSLKMANLSGFLSDK
jgi:hypothetical protein